MLYNLIKGHTPANVLRYINYDNKRATELVSALFNSYVSGNNTLSTPYWADKLGHQFLAKFIFGLSTNGWLYSKTNAKRKWGEFGLNLNKLVEFFTEEELLTMRTKARINKYRMRHITEQSASSLVRTPSGIKATGLNRPGFAKCVTQEFQLDTQYIIKYYDAVLANVTKSMDKMAQRYPSIKQDSANYGIISKDLLDYYLFNPDNKYTCEQNISDSRGRAIYTTLKRVFNPISSKDARSMLIVPKGKYLAMADSYALDEIYLFIAELIGSKSSSWNAKKLAGRLAYRNKQLHLLDLNDEHDRKELYENIWLERIYAKLDTLHSTGTVYWDIPLELDATMSLAQIAGILMNDQRLLDKTNVINPENLKDAWEVQGVPRLHTKTVGTPTFYGSAQTARSLLKSKNLSCTSEQIKLLNREFSTGAFSIVKGLKDFLIQHANVSTPTIAMHTWKDQYTVEVNKFKPVAANIHAYTAYDSASERNVTFINHEVVTVPNYDRFRLFYPTGLIHNLDSQVMDSIIDKLDEWSIGIHDAILVLPGTNARQLYVAELEDMRTDRHTIINNYRKSIGATSPASNIAWAKLTAKVEQLCSAVPFAESALK